MIAQEIPSNNSSKEFYYSDKIQSLRDIFGTHDLHVEKNKVIVRGIEYPVVDDVVILLPIAEYPLWLKRRVASNATCVESKSDAADVQFSFGEEWRTFCDILPEHEKEFADYFDIVNKSLFTGKRVCDLGCGIGRWSYFLRKEASEIILVDFSDAIFVARKNLRAVKNALFFMCDLRRLPFREDFTDFLLCLGVLHHLPINCLQAVRQISRYSPHQLIYLYYALDNRPLYFKILWRLSDFLRRRLCSIKLPLVRLGTAWLLTIIVYLPLIYLGKFLKLIRISIEVPLYESHRNDSLRRICQDCYDRFFTSIEQRVTQKKVYDLSDTYSNIVVGKKAPYWHFLCSR